MGIPQRPVHGLADPNHLRRDRETINDILTFRFDDSRVRTAAEVTAGVTPVNYAYQPGHVYRYGTNTAPGTTDMTAAIQAASVNGILIVPAGNYKTSAEITFDHVLLVLQGDVLFTGTGSFRGVLANDAIPHAAFQVPYNFVTAAERMPVVNTADYYIDPLLGVDTNAGTSATAAIRTLSQAATLVAAVHTTAPSLRIVLRSGRHETSGLTLNSNHTLTSGGNVIWIANYGENPVICAPTKWFFSSSTRSAVFNQFTAVANPLAYEFFDLWDAATGEPIRCADNLLPNYAMSRNQATLVTVAGAGPFTVTITLTTEDAQVFAALSSTEKAGVRMRLTHSFTTSWHMGLSLSASDLTGEAQTASAIYSNGWRFRSIDVFGCPYLLQNLKPYLDGTNFCAYSDNVWLPIHGTNYFTVDNTVTFLINTGAAAKHFFQGIRFRYLAAGYSTLKGYYLAGPWTTVGFLVGGTGASGANACEFAYGNLNGAVMCQTGANFTYNRIHHVGLSGISWNNSYGSDGAFVRHNIVRRWGEYTSAASCGIYGGGVGIDFSKNDCRNGPWCAMRADSTANITSPSGQVSGTVSQNVLMEVGFIDGAPADLIGLSDQGVLAFYGGSAQGAAVSTYVCAYTADQNIVGRGWGFQYIRGIFGDDGIQGMTVTNNLVWGSWWHAFDFRQVAQVNPPHLNTTFNNALDKNIFLGTVNFQSDTNTSFFWRNIVAATTGNFIDGTTTISQTNPSVFGIKCVATTEYPSINGQDVAWTAVPGTLIAAFTKSFLQTFAFISSGPVYETSSSKSIAAPITTATYTVLDEDSYLTFNRTGTVTVTMPDWTTCPGRVLNFRTITANTVVSAGTNVAPLAGGAFGTAILAATAGKWATLVADGTNAGGWAIVAAN